MAGERAAGAVEERPGAGEAFEELDPAVDPRKPVEQTVEPEEDLTVIDDIGANDTNDTEDSVPDLNSPEPEDQTALETDDAYLKRIEAGQGKNVVKEFQGKFAKLTKELEALKAGKPAPVAPVQTEPVTPDFTRVRPFVDKFKSALKTIDENLEAEGLDVKIGEQLFDPLMSIVFNAIHAETDFKINKDYGNEIGVIRTSAAEKNLDTAYDKTLKSNENLKFEATKYEKEVKKYIKENFDTKLWDKEDLIGMAFHKVMTDIKKNAPVKPAETRPVPKINERTGTVVGGKGNSGGVLRSKLEAEATLSGLDLSNPEDKATAIRIVKIKQKYGG